MPPDIVEKAVEPFFTTKDVGAGAGLGLSMVYGFVKQSAGGMQIESREGEGTKVTLYLPCAPEGALAGDEQGLSNVPRGSGETILVVEDDAELRRVARCMLESLGYRVVAAEDARDGMVKLASDDRIALLLSDVVLPGGFSGPDLAEAALVQRPDLKVVFMSGFTHRGARAHPLPPDAKLISKPFERRTVARLLSDELAAGPVEVQS
jgi:CheY-like chemotaxis protein